ncbi:uncharacterized protein LOC128549115 [Mercenaria mercenaria]|uniref:uncharacterized protein LOC128549115 n=1 Tax=Mercenaria mercenaria TaxID=6596 RepID=UPI00234ED764|nr:uncharacterized protein LOC128549115 [Mercenaria mercenaria]
MEAGLEMDLEKRVFSEIVLRLFDVRKITKRISPEKTISVYQGLKLKPLAATVTLTDNSIRDMNEVSKYKPEHVKVISCDSKMASFSLCTHYTSSGNRVEKVVTFNENLHWKITVCEKEIDLKSYGIKDSFTLDLESIQLVFDIVEKLKICSGMDIKKSTVCSRLHSVENWKNTDSDTCTRILRSVMCSRVVKVNSRSQTCKICQKMTIVKNKNSDKENATEINREFLLDKIPSASNEMIELLLSQVQNVGKHPKGRRWSRAIINVCLQLYTRSPVGYRLLMSSQMLVLPSPQLLVLYKSRVQHKIGFQDEIFRWMHTEALRLEIPVYGWKGGIIIDEMAIQKDVQIQKNGDLVELVGLVDVGPEGNMLNTLRMGKKEKHLGTHVLQFIFIGLTGFRFPFGHFVTDNIAAYDIHTLFWDAVAALSMYGFSVIYTSMDGAQSNRTFQNMNIGKDPQTMTAQCPEDPDNSVVLMMDVSHVIKKVRNNVIKSGISKGCTRNLILPDDSSIQWQMWVNAFEWDQINSLRIHRKLTREHIYPSTQSKMRNHLANEVLNKDMLYLMCQYQASLENGLVLSGAIEFLEKTSKIIEIFSDRMPVRSKDDSRLKDLSEVNDWFSAWSNKINSESISSAEKSKKLMSAQCRDDLHSCLLGFCELCFKVLACNDSAYVTPSIINSDIVENHFCQQRSTYNGANTNPSALQYRKNQNAIILGQNIISKKCNAGTATLKQAAQSFKFQDISSNKRKISNQSGSDPKKIKVLRM